MARIKTITKYAVAALGSICFFAMLANLSAYEATEAAEKLTQALRAGAGAIASLTYIQLAD